MHKATAALMMPLPKTNAITIESNITGIEKIVSIISEKNLSNKPPQYPLNKPSGNPKLNAKKIDRKTTSIAMEDPCKVLKQTSLPNLSVPQKCSREGGAKISLLVEDNIKPKKLLNSKNLIKTITKR